MAYSEDHIALAAEYALGTLDAGERTQVEMMMAVDTEFTTVVHAWEYRLGVLNQMVGSVEPRPIVWENIKAAIGHSGEQAPLVLPEATPPVAPVVEQVPVSVSPPDDSNVIQLSGRLKRMKTLASVATALAAALVAMLAIQIYQPDLLPDGLRAKPRIRTVEVKTPAPPAVPSAQYVALLQRDGGSPAFILTVDAATKNFTVRKVGTDAVEAGKSLELWLISDRLPQPRSLGVIGAGDFTARPVLASYDANTINAATYAVTVEQAGGSPDGKPHSTPIYTGKLIETVPAAR
ncbi:MULTISPECIES: anti-sigma factor [Bradyrhizobium]|jgi:anti-sigma-K factor RskA|uniref:Anti-sigma-K factor RskA n=2 Tax=Bradyrhizobium TaxID=374 RepID=A0ABY0PZT0_9BRAD|nr:MULTISPECIES: anti-sigma factor [Bradyrhizobium]SDJ24444.1 Anti-sigma-K factor RskA [Bradyrhizobium ottawaense]SEC77606.1 Anti-sigma-K factor RskA [Bradyrhizobium lablabi]SHK89385.1 Anti-sigma-K factor RskA [Bradyrhizobium lablabi]